MCGNGEPLFCILFAFGSGYCFADNEKPGMSECTYGILFGILGSGTMFVTSSLAAYSLTEWPDFIGLKPHWAMLLLPIPLAAGAFYARSRGKSPWGVAGRLLGYWAAAVLVLWVPRYRFCSLHPVALRTLDRFRMAHCRTDADRLGGRAYRHFVGSIPDRQRDPLSHSRPAGGLRNGRNRILVQRIRPGIPEMAANLPSGGNFDRRSYPAAGIRVSVGWLRLAEVLKQQYIPAPLPKSGIGCWLIRTGPNEEERRKVAEFLFSADCARLLTEADRLAALPFAVSATAGMTDAKLAEYRKAVEAIKHLSQLSEARALLHHYRQETEQILPEYERAIRWPVLQTCNSVSRISEV